MIWYLAGYVVSWIIVSYWFMYGKGQSPDDDMMALSDVLMSGVVAILYPLFMPAMVIVYLNKYIHTQNLKPLWRKNGDRRW